LGGGGRGAQPELRILCGPICTVMGWVHKATLALRKFLIYCVSLSDLESFLTDPPELSDNYQQTSRSEAGETWQEMADFAYEVSLSYS
jgi:hypothetical protein